MEWVFVKETIYSSDSCVISIKDTKGLLTRKRFT
uniref:Uncharacterized protein n=1 Tax=Lepeophtheirus salmonis TaxID=72036 RepID=A0A0K2VAM9_LEPSM